MRYLEQAFDIGMHGGYVRTTYKTRFVTWRPSHVSGWLCAGIDGKTTAGVLVKSQPIAACYKKLKAIWRTANVAWNTWTNSHVAIWCQAHLDHA